MGVVDAAAAAGAEDAAALMFAAEDAADDEEARADCEWARSTAAEMGEEGECVDRRGMQQQAGGGRDSEGSRQE